MKTRPNHYCMVSFRPSIEVKGGYDISSKILEIQGVVWFETEDLAYQYWGFMSDEWKSKQGSVFPVREDHLPFHFNCNTKYIKEKLTGTRLLKSKEPVGVLVSNDPETIRTYH